MATSEQLLEQIRQRNRNKQHGRTDPSDDGRLQDTRRDALRASGVSDTAEQGHASENGTDADENGLDPDSVGGSDYSTVRSGDRRSDDIGRESTDSRTDQGVKPIGIDFMPPDVDPFDFPSIPEMPAKERIHNRKAEKAVVNEKIPTLIRPDSVRSGAASSILSRLPVPSKRREKQADGDKQHTEEPRKAQARTISTSEASEMEENLSDMLQGISELLDAAREAYLKNHPSAEENPLFTLDEEENEQGTEWVLKRARKSARVARSVRSSTDLYDTVAVPAAILFPRIKQFIREVRENGITPRGR